MTEAQQATLKTVAASDATPLIQVDGRSVKSLVKQGLVKVRATKAGSFVSITAKGKKAVN